jgi:hypothetical protein
MPTDSYHELCFKRKHALGLPFLISIPFKRTTGEQSSLYVWLFYFLVFRKFIHFKRKSNHTYHYYYLCACV